jgi:hypothetical protein
MYIPIVKSDLGITSAHFPSVATRHAGFADKNYRAFSGFDDLLYIQLQFHLESAILTTGGGGGRAAQ